MSEKIKSIVVGTKVGMTQAINDDGTVVPLTLVKWFASEIIRHKTIENDGYQSVCLAYDPIDQSQLIRPKRGQFSANAYKSIKEFSVDSFDPYPLNTVVLPNDVLEVGKKYKVSSISIGRGMTGATKAWNFRRGPSTHGSKSHYILGSIGQATTPGKVNKGKKMHTRTGNRRVSVQSVVYKIDDNIIYLVGSLPGKNNEVVIYGG